MGGRRGSDLVLLRLWLWCGPAATALIGPLAWEPPYATGEALEKTERQKKKKKKKKDCLQTFTHLFRYDWFKLSFPKCLALEHIISEKKRICPGNHEVKSSKLVVTPLVSLLASLFYIILKISLHPIWDALKLRARMAGVRPFLGIENNNLEITTTF